MSGLRLTLRTPPEFALDARALLGPSADASGPPRDAAEFAQRQLPILYGRDTITVGELFDVTENDNDATVLVGDLTQFHGLAAAWSTGELIVEGDVGDAFCSGMSGGEVTLRGSAGNAACQQLRGGMVRITGDVGDDLGRPYPGRISGMRGGMVLVSGNAGRYAGYRLRRGTLVILGDCGDSLGTDMVAGTILVAGRASGTIGGGMRRGTIFLPHPPHEFAPRFTEPQPIQFGIAHLIADGLPQEAAALARSLRGPLVRHLGDLTAHGMGEIWRPAT